MLSDSDSSFNVFLHLLFARMHSSSFLRRPTTLVHPSECLRSCCPCSWSNNPPTRETNSSLSISNTSYASSHHLMSSRPPLSPFPLNDLTRTAIVSPSPEPPPLPAYSYTHIHHIRNHNEYLPAHSLALSSLSRSHSITDRLDPFLSYFYY